MGSQRMGLIPPTKYEENEPKENKLQAEERGVTSCHQSRSGPTGEAAARARHGGVRVCYQGAEWGRVHTAFLYPVQSVELPFAVSCLLAVGGIQALPGSPEESIPRTHARTHARTQGRLRGW